MANTNIISDEAFNATEEDKKYIFDKMFKSVSTDNVYTNFVKGITNEEFINGQAQKLFENGGLGDELVFLLEFTLALKKERTSGEKQNIIMVANAIRKRYLEIAADAWKFRNTSNEKYSIYLSSKNETPNILGDVRNFHNFRDIQLDIDKNKIVDGKKYAGPVNKIPSPKNYLMSKDDFYFASPFPGNKQSEGVQPIIINEFQPEVMFYKEAWASHLTADVIKVSGFDKLVGAMKAAFR